MAPIQEKDKIEGGGGSKTPFFSIIILSYNKEPFIEKCIKSCINQTFQNIEIIIVDDCSQDKTVELLNKYRDFKQLSIIQNSTNFGAFASRIIGEQHAKGEYIIHVDGDDFVKTTMCEILHPYCKTHQWDIIGFGWTNIGLDGKHTNMHHIIGKFSIKEVILKIGIATFAFKAQVIKKSNIFITQQLFKTLPNLNNLEDALKPFIISMFSTSYLGINNLLYICQNNVYSMTSDCSDRYKNKKMLKDIQLVIQQINITIKYFDIYNSKTMRKKIKKQFQPLLHSYTYIYLHSKAYESKPFAYPIQFFKSLWYTKYLNIAFKTLVRILIYFITFGKVKL